jgi:hypothetical protein
MSQSNLLLVESVHDIMFMSDYFTFYLPSSGHSINSNRRVLMSAFFIIIINLNDTGSVTTFTRISQVIE